MIDMMLENLKERRPPTDDKEELKTIADDEKELSKYVSAFRIVLEAAHGVYLDYQKSNKSVTAILAKDYKQRFKHKIKKKFTRDNPQLSPPLLFQFLYARGVEGEFLSGCLGKPDDRGRIKDYYGSFTEGTRDLALKQFDEWVQNKNGSKRRDQRVFVFVADAGMGKTALSSKIAIDRPDQVVAHHFCRHDREKEQNPTRMLMSLAAQLASRMPEYKTQLEKVLQEIDEDKHAVQNELLQMGTGEVFDTLFLEPLSDPDFRAPESGAKVVLIDGLDEASHDRKNVLVDALLNISQSFLKWLKVFVTTRPESHAVELTVGDILEGKLKNLNPLILKPLKDDDLEDLKMLFRARLEKYFNGIELDRALTILMERSKGSFIYAHYALVEIRWIGKQLTLQKLEEFPLGINRFYANQMDRIFSNKPNYKRTLEWKAVRYITSSLEPLHFDAMQILLGCTKDQAEHVARKLWIFFPMRGRTLQVYHKTVTDWLTEMKVDRTAYYISIESTRAELADRGFELLDKLLVQDHKLSNAERNALPYLLRYTTRYELGHDLKNGGKNSLSDRCEKLYLHNIDYIMARVHLADDTSNLIEECLSHSQIMDRQRVLYVFGRALQLSQGAVQASGYKELPSQMVGRLRGPSQDEPNENGKKILKEVVKRWRQHKYTFGSWFPVNPNWKQANDPTLMVNAQHTRWVRSVAWSPDGKRVASKSSDEIIRIWDPSTGRTERVLRGHTLWVNSIAWSPDDKQIVSGSNDETIRIWDPSTGKTKRVLQSPADIASSVAWSPDSKRIASGSDNGIIRIWDPSTGKTERILQGHTDTVSWVAWSPDGKQIASGSYDRTIRIWDPSTGKTEQLLQGHTDSVNSVAWSPDGKQIASGSWDLTVRIWDSSIGESKRVLQGHEDWVESVAWSPDGKRIASRDWKDVTYIWNLLLGEKRQVSAFPSSWEFIDNDLVGTTVAPQADMADPNVPGKFSVRNFSFNRNRGVGIYNSNRVVFLEWQPSATQTRMVQNGRASRASSGAVPNDESDSEETEASIQA